MIKIKQTKEYFQETCKCGVKIIGQTEKEVLWNLKVHKDSKNCKLRSKK